MTARPVFKLPEYNEPDGNVYSIISRVSRLLKKHDMKLEAEEFSSRAMARQSYEDVISLLGEYVEIE